MMSLVTFIKAKVWSCRQTLASSFVANSINSRLALVSIMLSLTACSSTTSDLSAIFQSLEADAVSIFDLLISFCYLAGALFVARGIFDFKVYGEQRTASAQQHSLRTPITYVTVGIFLLYAPNTITLLSESWLMQPTVMLAYLNPENASAGSSTWESLAVAMFTLIQICGLISFIRGCFMLTHIGGGQHGGTAKGMTHIVSGIVMLNLQSFLQILDNSI